MNSNSNYEFDAPTYVDFQLTNLDDDGADRFFDMWGRQENIKVEPGLDENTPPNNTDTDSSSAEPLVMQEMQMKLENLKVEPGLDENSPPIESVDNYGVKGEHAVQQGPPAVLQEVSTNIMKRKDEMERKRKMNSPLPGRAQKKYTSLAEEVLQFARKTPQRFHSRPRTEGYMKSRPIERKNPTEARSPNLVSVHRTRKVEYPTREELEEKELQEMRSFQLKANPVKEWVLHPPKVGPSVEKRSPLKVQPFNLTEFKKKDAPPEPVFTFKANPIPKGLFEHTIGLPMKTVIPLTIPKTPCISKPKLKVKLLEERDGQNYEVEAQSHQFGIPVSKWKPGKTEVKPFTFEERDKLLFERKEQKINEFLRKEKEAREFHAQPLPKFLKKSSSTADSLDGSSCSHSHSANCSTVSKEDSEVHLFKARPAVVLQKEPFVPKKNERIPVTPEEVKLRTEKRAEERKAFEALLHEKELMEQQYLQMLQEQKERQEAEEIARLRKAAVHKANPMPAFKSPGLNIPKKSPTVAASPNFSERFKK